jgi:hypothetical protein
MFVRCNVNTDLCANISLAFGSVCWAEIVMKGFKINIKLTKKYYNKWSSTHLAGTRGSDFNGNGTMSPSMSCSSTEASGVFSSLNPPSPDNSCAHF